MKIESELSLFYKILIYIEDKGKVHPSELNLFGSLRQTLGAIGRLEGLHYIERIKEADQDFFTLTQKGDYNLATVLSYLPQVDKPWDEKWRVVLFDVPESQRTVRQMFRLKLYNLGARMLQSSVWITPHATVIEQFRQVLVESDFSNLSVHFFEAAHVGVETIDIASLWKLEILAAHYKSLFTYFRQAYPSLSRHNQASFEAKCLIVLLALTAKHDPQLPSALMPKPWVGQEAQDWYRKLRSYCT